MILTGPASLLVMATMLVCEPAPIPDEERANITAAAHEARPETLADTEFETSSLTKCVIGDQSGDRESDGHRTEVLTFYGQFAYNEKTEDYNERWSVTCRRAVEISGDSEHVLEDDCAAERERHIRYAGIDHDIHLDGTLSVADATAFLDHLMAYDFGAENRQQVLAMLRRIEEISSTRIKGQPGLEASYSHSGCSTTFFRATMDGSQPLVFGKVDDMTMVC